MALQSPPIRNRPEFFIIEYLSYSWDEYNIFISNIAGVTEQAHPPDGIAGKANKRVAGLVL
jgi:hypothetical protein